MLATCSIALLIYYEYRSSTYYNNSKNERTLRPAFLGLCNHMSHMLQNVEPPQELAWILEEGHDLVCIEIAEKLAKIVGIDEIRVDIFIKKGQPKNAMVNEDSISSGSKAYRLSESQKYCNYIMIQFSLT